MKKRIIISSLIALLCVPTFASCDNNDSSLNQITSSSNDDVVTNTKRLNNMLSSLRKGFTFDGNVKQTKHLLDGYYGNKTGETEIVNYDCEFIYEMSEENGYSSKIISNDGEKEKTILDLQVFEGDDGYAYFYELNYDNTVKKYPIMGMQSYEEVNFSYYCMNPFEYLIPSDFTKTGENTYKLSNTKSAFFASTVLVDVSGAFLGKIDFCEFTLEGDTLKSFKLIPHEFHLSETDVENLSAVYFMSDYEATFDVKDIGSAKVEKAKPREVKPEHAALQTAFDAFACNNYTINMYILFTNQEDEELGENFFWYYYDGDELYISFDYFQNEPNLTGGDYFKPNQNGMYNVGGQMVTYKQLMPVLTDVKAELFDYNPDTDTYKVCKEMVSYIGSIALVPPISTIGVELSLDITDNFEIKLGNDGNIEYIDFSYEYEQVLYTEFANARMTFSNIGTTVIPNQN